MSILGVGFRNINWGLPFKAPSPGKNKTALISALVVLGGVAGLLGIAFYRRRRVKYGQQLAMQSAKANEAIAKWLDTDRRLRQQGVLSRPEHFNLLCSRLVECQTEISVILEEAISNERLDQINKIIIRLSVLQPYFELAISSWLIEGSGYSMKLKIPIEGKQTYLSLSSEHEKQLSNIMITFERAHQQNYVPTTDELKRLREGVPFVAAWLKKAKEKHSNSVFS